MSDLLRPPVTDLDYLATRRYLTPILVSVPPCDRDDLLQEIILSAGLSYRSLSGTWRTHLYRVGQRRKCDYFRHRHPTTPLPDGLADTLADEHDWVPAVEAAVEVGWYLDYLSPRQRRAITTHNGGRIAHRARLRLRELANPKLQEVTR